MDILNAALNSKKAQEFALDTTNRLIGFLQAQKDYDLLEFYKKVNSPDFELPGFENEKKTQLSS